MRKAFVRKEAERKVGALPQESIYLRLPHHRPMASRIHVLMNPCAADFKAMEEDSVERFGEPTGHDTMLRFLEDDDGNMYYWVSGDGIHTRIDPILMAQAAAIKNAKEN